MFIITAPAGNGPALIGVTNVEIILEQRNVYGSIKFYPVNPLAAQFAALMKQKTLDARNVRDIRDMGITVTVQHPALAA